MSNRDCILDKACDADIGLLETGYAKTWSFLDSDRSIVSAAHPRNLPLSVSLPLPFSLHFADRATTTVRNADED